MMQECDLNDGTPITLRINGQDFTVMDANVWIEAHKRIGMAEGLLSGWLALSPDDDKTNAVAATKRFLGEEA